MQKRLVCYDSSTTCRQPYSVHGLICSFSAAETRWTHLLKTLGKIVEKKDYIDDEIKQMTWEQKSDLIQKDPVTCARNFDHMVQLFSCDILKSSVIPVKEK